MPYEYSAENHDWDLTLRSSYNLLLLGNQLRHLPTTGNLEQHSFACFTGSMLLAFCAIESFSASVAFSMPETERFRQFDFETYRRSRQFWIKIGMLFAAISYKIDKSQGLFQTIAEMQEWRNLVTHSSPYRVKETIINSPLASPKLHSSQLRKEYTRRTDLENAKRFYQAAFDYIELLTAKSGVKPLASATYRLDDGEVEGARP